MAEIWLPSHGQLPPQPLHTHRPGIFSQLPPSRTGARSFLQRCPLLNICPESAGQNIWICSYGKTFNSMYLLESSSGLGYWNCFRRIKYNKNYIYIYIFCAEQYEDVSSVKSQANLGLFQACLGHWISFSFTYRHTHRGISQPGSVRLQQISCSTWVLLAA